MNGSVLSRLSSEKRIWCYFDAQYVNDVFYKCANMFYTSKWHRILFCDCKSDKMQKFYVDTFNNTKYKFIVKLHHDCSLMEKLRQNWPLHKTWFIWWNDDGLNFQILFAFWFILIPLDEPWHFLFMLCYKCCQVLVASWSVCWD